MNWIFICAVFFVATDFLANSLARDTQRRARRDATNINSLVVAKQPETNCRDRK
jgi:hypothetical protein